MARSKQAKKKKTTAGSTHATRKRSTLRDLSPKKDAKGGGTYSGLPTLTVDPKLSPSIQVPQIPISPMILGPNGQLVP